MTEDTRDEDRGPAFAALQAAIDAGDLVAVPQKAPGTYTVVRRDDAVSAEGWQMLGEFPGPTDAREIVVDGLVVPVVQAELRSVDDGWSDDDSDDDPLHRARLERVGRALDRPAMYWVGRALVWAAVAVVVGLAVFGALQLVGMLL